MDLFFFVCVFFLYVALARRKEAARPATGTVVVYWTLVGGGLVRWRVLLSRGNIVFGAKYCLLLKGGEGKRGGAKHAVIKKRF